MHRPERGHGIMLMIAYKSMLLSLRLLILGFLESNKEDEILHLAI